MTRFFALVIVLCLTGSFSTAGGYKIQNVRSQRVYQQRVVRQVVFTPSYQAGCGATCQQQSYAVRTFSTYSAPSYQAAATYSAPTTYTYQAQRAVSPYFYSASEPYSAPVDKNLLADAIAFRVLQALKAQGVNGGGAPIQQNNTYLPATPAQTYIPQEQQYSQPQPAPAPTYTPQLQPMPEVAPTPKKDEEPTTYIPGRHSSIGLQKVYAPAPTAYNSSSGSNVPTVSVDRAIQQIANNSCVSCHSGPGVNKIDLRDMSKLSAVQRGKCATVVTYGLMPKGKGKMSESVQKVFEVWANSKRGG